MKIVFERPRLADYQKAILYSSARFTITEASTKAGKTFSHLFWLFEYAHGYEDGKHVLEIDEGMNFWWVAPSHGQAKIAFKRLKKKIRKVPGYLVNNSTKTIETPEGAVIMFKTSKDDDALYGEDVHAAVFDEAPRAKREAWIAIRSTLTATRGKCKMIGNFGGISNWMHLLKEKAKTDPAYSYHKVTAWDAVRAGILEKEEVEQAQRDLSVRDFKALYLAEAQEAEEMLCSYDSINDLWTNTHVKRASDQMFITADIAFQGSDKFIVFVWKGLTVIDIVVTAKCEADEVEKLLKDLSLKYHVPRSNIVYDADGLGSFLRGYLKGAKPFNNGGAVIPIKGAKPNYKNLKTQCAYKLAQLINASEIFIEVESDEIKSNIIRELECLQSYDNDSDGKVQILPKAKVKEIIGNSPDFLDNFIMRMLFLIQPKRKAPKSVYK